MKNSTKIRIAFLILILSVVTYTILIQYGKEKTFSKTYTDYLDTVSEITIISKNTKPLKSCEEYLKFAESEFTAEDENSTLYKYNQNTKNQKYSDDFIELINISKDFTERYPDYFSIYLDDIIKLWNISGSPDNVPTNSEIEFALSNDSVNLGGIAKGYITDKIVEKLKAENVDSALINLGGNIYALGKKQNGNNWKVGIQDPKNPNEIIGVITAEDIAIVTSGDYQRYTEIDGKKYHHIFDPKTGSPVHNEVRSVTVICKDATTADALSTIAFVAGVEKGNEILKENNAMGIFITDDTIYFSKGLENIFRQDNLSYKYQFLY